MVRIDVSSLFRRVPGGWKTVLAIVIAFVFGLSLGGGDAPNSAAPSASPGESQVKWYTCSMHPQIRLQDPNALCPICGMELIPVTGDSGGDEHPRRLTMSEAAKELAEIETAPVERRIVVKEVQLVGKVDYDETRLRTITAWVSGRLDRLYVDYTGVAVRKGAPMVYMYSPELFVGQQAYLKSLAAYEEMKARGVDARNLERQKALFSSAEEQLRLWGLTDAQVREIRERGEPSDHMTILSPISGIVTAKKAVEGDYVGVGTKIYEIADLSRVWVFLDAYESDLSWVKYAQEVTFEAEAYPGEVFRGRISFIDPFLDEMTRTVKVRVTVDNVDGRLKPGMFVRARIHAALAEGGRIVEPFLAGKWISPVHPEVVRDAPGECPICGTPLVSAESLGYVDENAPAPLVVPATAPLRTGKRAVVYVEVPGAERPTYEGREVRLGPRTRHHYLVRGGLEEGELVVVKGNFKIDSALQILARPSMMSPVSGSGGGPALAAPPSFLRGLSPVYAAYLRAQRALAADQEDAAKQALKDLAEVVGHVDMRRIAGRAHEAWMGLSASIEEHARAGARGAGLEAVRSSFDALSQDLVRLLETFGQATGSDLHEAFCPMAFSNRGAVWLTDEKTIRNPYFGERMLECGEIRRSFPSDGQGPRVAPAFRRALAPFYDALLEAQRALASDQLGAAQAAGRKAAAALDGIMAAPGATWLADVWLELRTRGAAAAEALAGAEDIAQARAAFERLSGVGLATVTRFGHLRPAPLVEAFCPMAFDNRGASWLQEGKEIQNPYFGTAMPSCGEVRATFAPAAAATVPAAFRKELARLVDLYLKIADALAADDRKAATDAAAALDDALTAVPGTGLAGEDREVWTQAAGHMRSALESLRKAGDLESVRRPFALVSDSLAIALRRFGAGDERGLVQVHCPMAFSNRGADWIQRGEEIANPYFGAAMLRCGDVVHRFDAEGEAGK